MRERFDVEEEETTRRRVTSATYLHRDCGGYTTVSGFDFNRVADPFEFVPGTYCASCGRSPGLGSCEWAGSEGRTLRQWRAAMRQKAPASLAVFRWLLGPLLLAALGCGVGLLINRTEAVAAIVGAIVAPVFGSMYILGPLSRMIWSDFYLRARRSAAR
jgi:hypothetical protein